MLIREKNNPACSHLVSIAGTTYGDRMARFDFLRSQRKWLTDSLAILLVGLLLTTGVWFCFEPPVFALLQGLLLVFVLSGCSSHSCRGSSESQNLSLLELPFALAHDVDTFARYQSMSQAFAKIWEQHVRRLQNQQVRGHHSGCRNFVMQVSRTRRLRFLRAERVVRIGCCRTHGCTAKWLV